jgi:hypothetical protein
VKNLITRTTSNLSLIAVSVTLMFLCWTPGAQDIEFVERVSATVQDDGVPQWVWDKPVWEPCEYEDSRNCVWNAKRRGNGIGDSVIVTSKGRVIVIKHWQAYRLVHPNYAP